MKQSELIILGISAGFASVFGTPIAGAIFAVELVGFDKKSFRMLIYSFFTAYIAHFVVRIWAVQHTHYPILVVPTLSLVTFVWSCVAGVLFGLAAMLFSRSGHYWQGFFAKYIAYAPFRPLVGGSILAVLFLTLPLSEYIGLGVPTIVMAFLVSNAWYVFLLKILLTTFTLGSGFKGGEVTPLFFVGATLGSALFGFVPMPLALLAAMGFVAVFAGATHTPVACTLMGMELFGVESGFYIALACVMAYFCSGTVGIYSSQAIKGAKRFLYNKIKAIYLCLNSKSLLMVLRYNKKM